jgi:hypothetical protein
MWTCGEIGAAYPLSDTMVATELFLYAHSLKSNVNGGWRRSIFPSFVVSNRGWDQSRRSSWRAHVFYTSCGYVTHRLPDVGVRPVQHRPRRR